MFDRETVLVLGAGASWHYGYPTGEELVGAVLYEAANLATVLNWLRLDELEEYPSRVEILQALEVQDGDVGPLLELLGDFVLDLRANDPVVIDYFLGHNKRYAAIGRCLIGASLWKRSVFETYSDKMWHYVHARAPIREKLNNNWIRFIASKIVSRCRGSGELFDNKLFVINFNYDRSFEDVLRKSLLSLSTFSEEHVDRFLSERIYHIYGAVGRHAYEKDRQMGLDALGIMTIEQGEDRFDKVRRMLDLYVAIVKSSLENRIIDPDEKDGHADQCDVVGIMSKARTWCFLGFGFDQNNLNRIGVSKAHESAPRKNIFYTNYSNSKKIDRLFGWNLGVGDRMVSEGDVVVLDGQDRVYITKSDKDVYDALAFDFDL